MQGVAHKSLTQTGSHITNYKASFPIKGKGKKYMDFYTVLGVSKTASAAEIKSAYRKLALKWHPDRNKSAEATTKFKEINKAYEVLSDIKKKEVYDQVGHDGFARGGYGSAANQAGQGYQQGPFSYSYSSSAGNPFEGFDPSQFGGFSDPFEIFEQFFGFQNGGQRRQRRPVYSLKLTFREAVNGVEKDVSIDGKRRSVKVPAGINDGNRVRFNEFDLLVAVEPDKTFRREGQDLYVEQDLSYAIAVLGGTVEVLTLSGRIKLKVRKGTESGTLVRLKDEGVVYPNTSRKGNLYVVFKIRIPEKVSGKAKKLLEELQKEGL